MPPSHHADQSLSFIPPLSAAAFFLLHLKRLFQLSVLPRGAVQRCRVLWSSFAIPGCTTTTHAQFGRARKHCTWVVEKHSGLLQVPLAMWRMESPPW